MRGLVVIEYCGEEVRPGIWRRYGTFRIGDAIQLDHIVTEDSWNVKWGVQGLSTDEENAADYLAVRDNHFGDPLREVFEVAGIDYGRADFGLVDGRPQVYEINTNPFLAALSEDTSPIRTRSLRLAHERFAFFLHALDNSTGGVPLELSMPRAMELRQARQRERELIEGAITQALDRGPASLAIDAVRKRDLGALVAKISSRVPLARRAARVLRGLARKLA